MTTEAGYEFNDGLLAPAQVWLTVPLPSYRLTPNGTRNRMERHRLASAARSAAYLTARALLPDSAMPFFGRYGRARLDVTVHLPKGRKRLDDDGLIGMLKSTVDGLQGPIVGNDNLISWGAITWTRAESGGGAVLLRLTEVAE